MDEIYSEMQIRGDLAFLKYAIRKNQVQLRPDTGLQKLINDCEHYLEIPVVSQEEIKPITVLYTIVNSLKNLWLSDTGFTIQLRSMNTGQYEYGNADPNSQHFFKDFEFEIFSASQLINNQLQIDLPQHSLGEDLQVGDIYIQCKHPNTLNQVEANIRNFSTRLNQNRQFGVFGLAVDDCFNYAEQLIFMNDNDLKMYLQNKSDVSEQILGELFKDHLARATRILGLYTTATYFVLISGYGLRLVRRANSVFCFRPDRNEITDTLYKQAYKVISTFNPHPNWLTIQNQTLQSIN